MITTSSSITHLQFLTLDWPLEPLPDLASFYDHCPTLLCVDFGFIDMGDEAQSYILSNGVWDHVGSLL